MDQRGYSPYAYSPFQSPMEVPMSHESHRYGSQGSVTPEPCQESFNGNTYYTALAQDWHPTAFPASPSATSSLSGSDGYSPPRYVEQQPLPAFSLAEQSLPIPARTASATSHPDWNVPMVASNWQEGYQDAPTWSPSHAYVAQPWQSNPHYFPSSVGSAIPPVVPSMVQVMPAPIHNTARSNFQDMQSLQASHGFVGENYQDEDETFTVDGSDSESCSDEEDTDLDASKSSANVNSREPTMKVHKFSAYSGNHMQAVQYIRPHVCDLADKRNPNKMCGTRFVRPEHLRRHKKTVHAPPSSAHFSCKVADCTKRFNRGDNLRDHYFTHVERGGRSGKNRKMDLKDMKYILGPKDKELYMKLAKKYKKHILTKRRSGPKL